MTDAVLPILGLSFLGSIAGLIGGVIFLIKKNWAQKLSEVAVPFAAGVLLSVSLVHLIPEASEEIGEAAFLWVLITFLASFIFEQYFATLHHHEHRKGTMTKIAVPLVLFGDTIHNFIDGVTIAASYMIDPSLGLIIAIATFLHETPHEIGDFGVLLSAGWSRVKTFWANAISASSTFLGALFVLFLTGDINNKIAIFLSISAGVFLYLGASDFLPEVGEEGDRNTTFKQVLLVILGSLIMYTLRTLLPENS